MTYIIIAALGVAVWYYWPQIKALVKGGTDA